MKCWAVIAAGLLLPFTQMGCPGPLSGLTVSDVEIDDHALSVLACVVRWTTSEPATSRVEFGPGPQYLYFVEDDALVTDHEVVVIGLAADTESHLQVVSAGGDGVEARSDDLTRTPAALPFPSATTAVVTHAGDRIEPGWTLSNLAVSSALTLSVAVMFDDQGRIVWYHQLGDETGTADLEVSLVGGDHVLIGGSIPPLEAVTEVDLEGNVVWQGPVQPEGLIDHESMHHSMKKLPNGNYVTMFRDFEEGNSSIHDRIDEFTPELEVVWSWSALPVQGMDQDHIQGNGLEVDLDEDVLYFTARLTNTLYKIDRNGGDVLWTLGEGGDFEMSGAHAEPWFGRAHAPEVLADGNVLYYDNGSPGRGYSRLVEYALDEGSMTASIAWEYDGSETGDEWATTALGDVDRLPGGNTLACAGSMYEDDSPSRIIEVDPDGELVWEMILEAAAAADERAACYMVQRIPIPVGLL
jgi:hypothetical protein